MCPPDLLVITKKPRVSAVLIISIILISVVLRIFPVCPELRRFDCGVSRDRMWTPPSKKTKTGKVSTSKATILTIILLILYDK